MKKFLVICISIICVIACTDGGYSEYNLYSYSEFEFSSSYFTDSLYLNGPFYGGSSSAYIYFNSNGTTSNDMTGGFGLSMKRDSSLTISPTNAYPQYTMYATTAGWESDVCAIFCQNDDDTLMPDHDIIFTETSYGTCTPNSVQVNNTQQTVYSLLSDESTIEFEAGDYLTLTFTGIYGSSVTGTTSFSLVDYTGLTPTVITDWTTVSLTSLGQIEYVDLALETNIEGLQTTVCIDNFLATIYVRYE